MKLFWAFVLLFFVQIIAFIQLQGQMKWVWAKENPWIMASLGLPIGYILIITTSLFNEWFGINWPGRLIGQGFGVIVFSMMSWIVFKEPITIKTGICILLALGIVFIQMFWKN